MPNAYNLVINGKTVGQYNTYQAAKTAAQYLRGSVGQDLPGYIKRKKIPGGPYRNYRPRQQRMF